MIKAREAWDRKSDMGEDDPDPITNSDYYEFDEDIILNLSAEDFYNNAPDIGAIEYGFLSVNDNIQIPTIRVITAAKKLIDQSIPN